MTSGDKQRPAGALVAGMAPSIIYWSKFVAGCPKLATRSENCVTSGHVLAFLFNENCVKATVQSSMKDRSYHVKVRYGHDIDIHIKLASIPSPIVKLYVE